MDRAAVSSATLLSQIQGSHSLSKIGSSSSTREPTRSSLKSVRSRLSLSIRKRISCQFVRASRCCCGGLMISAFRRFASMDIRSLASSATSSPLPVRALQTGQSLIYFTCLTSSNEILLLSTAKSSNQITLYDVAQRKLCHAVQIQPTRS